MTQQIEIQREMQSDIQQLFHSYEGKKAGGQMVISNWITLAKKQDWFKMSLVPSLNCFILSAQ